MEAPKICHDCGLRLTDGGEMHFGPASCVNALKRALLKQRAASEQLGVDITSRVLHILEQLAARPENAFTGFSVLEPGTLKPLVVPGQQVQGIIANIHRQFMKMGDWSPMAEAREQANAFAWMAGQATGLLMDVVKLHDDEMSDTRLPDEMVEKIKALMERLQQLSGHQPGPPDS